MPGLDYFTSKFGNEKVLVHLKLPNCFYHGR